ncbi:MAG TPA: nuclear transport factor 2 family protein, partial [Burkholderiaceae bacterium]|nr:nuclear transport factor 2 family protein [Burkholderiaceae bacterium]
IIIVTMLISGALAGMMALWSADDEVVCTHPGHERLVGLDAVRASWESIFASGGVDVQPTGAIIQAGGVLAVHNLVERIAISGPLGNQIVECVVTNVYAKTSMGWRIVLHHGSPVRQTQAAAPSDAVLH